MNNKIKVLFQPNRLIAAFIARFCTWLPEDIFLRCRYRLLMHKKLHLDNPVMFTEKIQWLKLYDRKDVYTRMADKYDVKEYVAKCIGEQYVIPTLGVWKSFDDIDFTLLPNEFVLKTTNGGGGTGVIICNDINKFDKKKARQLLNSSMKYSADLLQGEWVYKGIKPRIIAEKLISDKETGELKDYNFFCFNGKVRFFKVDFNRFIGHHANYYDINGHLMPFGESICPPEPNFIINLPHNLAEMISLAEKLSSGHTFLRVDFYNVNGIIYFGETTFYPNSGFGEFEPKEWDLKIGKMLELPISVMGGVKLCNEFIIEEVRICA